MAMASAVRSTTRQRWLTTFGVLTTLLAFSLALRVLAGPAPVPGDDAALAGSPGSTPDGQAAPLPLAAAPTATPADLPATATDAAAQQAAAQDAVRREIGRPELAGRLTARPAFVSDLEWQALQAVALNHATPARELTRLVNNLRFNKLLELWRAGGLEAATRARLGEALLAALPARVQQKEYGTGMAQLLQQELLAVLEPDPVRRAARLETEARRIGAKLLEESGTPVP